MLTISIRKKLSHFSLDVDFTVENEIVVLFGPSGSGKTTVLNCLSGISTPDNGRIRLNRKMLYEKGRKPLPIQHRHIGYVFQEYALFPHMTVLKNITYAKKSMAFVDKIMEELHITHLKDHYPHHISGGEKQRVSLARALATEPELLLLDEPFSALDEKTRAKSHEELLRLHQLWKIPIMLVTHNREEAEKLGDRILFIETGKIVEIKEKQADNSNHS